MSYQERERICRALLEKAEGLRAKKAHDYGRDDEPYSNFIDSGSFLGIDVRIGILVRLLDKVARINSFITKGRLENESFEDACIDIINYTLLLYGYQVQEGEGKGQLRDVSLRTPNGIQRRTNLAL